MRSKKRRIGLLFATVSTILYIMLNIIFYFFVVVVIIRASKYAYHFSYQVFGKVSVTKESPKYEVKIEVKQGDSTMQLAKFLEEKKIILDQYSFYTRAKLSKSKILPGKYKLDSSMDYDEIFEILTKKEKGELEFEK